MTCHPFFEAMSHKNKSLKWPYKNATGKGQDLPAKAFSLIKNASQFKNTEVQTLLHRGHNSPWLLNAFKILECVWINDILVVDFKAFDGRVNSFLQMRLS